FPRSPLWQQPFKFQLQPRILVRDSTAWVRLSRFTIGSISTETAIGKNRAHSHRSFAPPPKPFLALPESIPLRSAPKYRATCLRHAALGVALLSDLVYYSG